MPDNTKTLVKEPVAATSSTSVNGAAPILAEDAWVFGWLHTAYAARQSLVLAAACGLPDNVAEAQP